MAKPEWGFKRVCQSCGARYYDLIRTPIVCPACATPYDPEAVLKSRRSRPLPVDESRKPRPANDEAEDQETEDDEVEGDDADEGEKEPLDGEPDGDSDGDDDDDPAAGRKATDSLTNDDDDGDDELLADDDDDDDDNDVSIDAEENKQP